MGDKIESSRKNLILDIVQFEGVFNTCITLTKPTYDVWSQLIEMYIFGREKLSYIHRKIAPPIDGEEGCEKLYAKNQKFKRWLLISLTLEIMKRCAWLPTAHANQIALAKAFYDGNDELKTFALNQNAFRAKQNGRSLSEYSSELIVIFQELDHRGKVFMKDLDDIEHYKKSIERLRV